MGDVETVSRGSVGRAWMAATGSWTMDDMWTRVGEQLMARVSGPMHFRLYLQPGMAAVLAIIAGLKDGRAGYPPYLRALFTDSPHLAERLKDGWKSVGRVFILAIVLDAIYQGIVLHYFYVGEAIIVAVVLAIVPYVILREIVGRLARKRLRPSDGERPM
jgi:hypothetical protein